MGAMRQLSVYSADLNCLTFHLYGIAREDVDYILEIFLEIFPIVSRKEIAAHGE